MEFTALGRSNSHLSMLLEYLYQKHGNSFRLKIVENVSQQDSLPYDIYNLSKTVRVDDWTKNETDKYILGVYNPNPKELVFKFFFENYSIDVNHYESIIYQSAKISMSVSLSKSVFIGPSVTLAPFAKLDSFVSINRGVTIGHHTEIGQFTTINPGSNIAGCCNIGKNVLIGIGSTIIDGIEVGSGSIIGAGSVVTKSIPPDVVVYGVPAKIVRYQKKKS